MPFDEAVMLLLPMSTPVAKPLARVSNKSATVLGLSPCKKAYAQIKAVSIL